MSKLSGEEEVLLRQLLSLPKSTRKPGKPRKTKGWGNDFKVGSYYARWSGRSAVRILEAGYIKDLNYSGSIDWYYTLMDKKGEKWDQFEAPLLNMYDPTPMERG